MRRWTAKKFTTRPRIGIAVASYLHGEDSARRFSSLCCLLHSFCAQTYANWHILVTHDGPLDAELQRAIGVSVLHDSRITIEATPVRKQQFGHPHRQAAIEKLIQGGAEWLALTNDDNYYAPVYLEWLLHQALEKKADFVYCDMVHSHHLWKPLAGELRRGRIDVGGFLVRATVAAQIKFDNYTFAGDWDYISRLQAKSRIVVKVPATLFTHN